MELDIYDKKILAFLRKDSQMTLKDMEDKIKWGSKVHEILLGHDTFVNKDVPSVSFICVASVIGLVELFIPSCLYKLLPTP